MSAQQRRQAELEAATAALEVRLQAHPGPRAPAGRPPPSTERGDSLQARQSGGSALRLQVPLAGTSTPATVRVPAGTGAQRLVPSLAGRGPFQPPLEPQGSFYRRGAGGDPTAPLLGASSKEGVGAAAGGGGGGARGACRRGSQDPGSLGGSSARGVRMPPGAHPIFEQAAALVDSVVAQLDGIDIFYDALDNRVGGGSGGGGGGAGGKRLPPPGGAARGAAGGGGGGGALFFKRRRAEREARWSDFVRYLSRHPEQRCASAEGLRAVYDAWRAGFGYVAEFSTMLRALRRHGQLLGSAADTERGVPLRYAEPFGQDLDPSSSEEENVDFLVQEQDARLGQLGRAVARQAEALARAEAHHARELSRRTADLERHHAGLMAAAARRHAAESAANAAAVRELEVRIRELEALVQPPSAPAAGGAGVAAGPSDGEGTQVLSPAEERIAGLEAANAALVREIAAQHAVIDSLRSLQAQRDILIEDSMQRLKLQVFPQPKPASVHARDHNLHQSVPSWPNTRLRAARRAPAYNARTNSLTLTHKTPIHVLILPWGCRHKCGGHWRPRFSCTMQTCRRRSTGTRCARPLPRSLVGPLC
jgi:hypothetical protein